MKKLLACVIFLTIALSSQNVLAATEYIEGGTTSSCVGPAGISGVSTPNEVITETGGITTRDIVIPDTTVGTSALFADKNFNIGFAQAATGRSSKTYDQYALLGGHWTTNNPQLQYTYYTSGQPTKLVSSEYVENDINVATSLWDSKTLQQLFGSTGTGNAVTTTKNEQFSFNTLDGIHEVGWANLGTTMSSAIAMTSLRWNTKTGSMIDADVGFNKQWCAGWTTDEITVGPLADVETIALHEFGHVLGLDDIYNKPSKMFDTTEIMNSYRGSHRYLGDGDKTGLHVLYGL